LKHPLFIFLLPGLLLAQVPQVGAIEFYGARKLSGQTLLKILAINPGDRLPPSKGAVEERLEEIPGVLRAHLEAACCQDGKAILYVGIEEKGGIRFVYRDPPKGEMALPEEIHDAYARFLKALLDAGHANRTSEDLTQGHSLMDDPSARAMQERFLALAPEHLESLRNVLRESKLEEERAIAAYVLGYAADKSAVTADLQFALQDPDNTVRSNAMRALAAFAVKAQKENNSDLRVSPTWLIEMLNSVVWTDRNNAAIALVTLTESRDRNILDQIKERAFSSVLEMARWKHLPHALPAYILLGRITGLLEKELQNTWSRGERTTVIERAAKLMR